jgi:hypothetical protein
VAVEAAVAEAAAVSGNDRPAQAEVSS